MFSFQYFFLIWVLEVITTVMTSTYYFYFIFVPRRTSNLREVRFGEVVVLKQISALHHKNSWKFSEYLFDLKFIVHMPQVISKLSLVSHFSIWATEGPRKIRHLTAVLFWKISATICVCLSIVFFLCFFYHGTFEEVPIVVYALYVVFFSLKLNQKGLIHYYVYANVANRIVWSSVWRKFSSVGIGEWWDEMKYGKSSSLGMPMSPQKISKRYKCQSLGMPPRHHFFISKNHVTFQHTIFLLPHILYVFLGASLLSLLVFFCFVC
jgi:hypothetical protein